MRLGQLLGEKPTIWRDQKLQGSDVFDDKIVNAFREAKVMISIMSPSYMKSEWCLKELNEFYKAASDIGWNVFGNELLPKRHDRKSICFE